MSIDHKPSLPREAERVKKAGGRVVDDHIRAGSYLLAVSRAIGDFDFKPAVSAIPDITVTPLTKDVKFMVLATDGVWDCNSSK